MMRYDDLLELVRITQPQTETWIPTSGYGIDEEKARELREAGLSRRGNQPGPFRSRNFAS